MQVLNEFIAVCRKAGRDRETAYALADAIANASIVHDITQHHRLAQALPPRATSFHTGTVLGIAAATLAQCETLYSEDLSMGWQVIERSRCQPFMTPSSVRWQGNHVTTVQRPAMDGISSGISAPRNFTQSNFVHRCNTSRRPLL